MSDQLREQLAFLPDYLRGHLLLSLLAMGISIAISLPLGILVTRVRPLRPPVMLAISIIQTIPSLAILALTVALLGGRIGFLPALIALILYSMLPIVRNTVAGLDGVPENVIEAARGIGMTPSQVLFRIRLPLATPVILAGIRTATVWTVGLATLSTLVGATSLGNYIFTGIQTSNLTAVTLGSVVAAALAIVLDLALAAIERAMVEAPDRSTTSSKTTLLKKWGTAGLAAGVLLAAVGIVTLRRPPDYVVAAKGFTEQYIIAGVMTALLEKAGFRVEQRTGLGSDVPFFATAQDEVSAYVEYSGTVWANHMNRKHNPGREAVLREVLAWVEEKPGIEPLGPTGFENRYAIAMRRARAAAMGIQSIEDLAPHAEDMSCGGDLEFFGRPEWIQLRDAYDIDFREKRTFDATLMYTAVDEEQVDLITAYTTDGRVDAFDLLILEDPRHALLPYDGILLVSSQCRADEAFVRALGPMIEGITTEQMRQANKMVDVDGRSVQDAIDFLMQKLSTRTKAGQ